MKDWELFEALGKVRTEHIEQALHSRSATGSARIQSRMGAVFRGALVAGLIAGCWAGAMKLRDLGMQKPSESDTQAAQSIPAETTAPIVTSPANDTPASSRSPVTQMFRNHAVCEADGGWYFIPSPPAKNGYSDLLIFKDEKSGVKREIPFSEGPLLDIAMLNGRLYALSMRCTAKLVEEDSDEGTLLSFSPELRLTLHRYDAADGKWTMAAEGSLYGKQNILPFSTEMIASGGELWFAYRSASERTNILNYEENGKIPVMYQISQTKDNSGIHPNLCSITNEIMFQDGNTIRTSDVKVEEITQNGRTYTHTDNGILREKITCYTASGGNVWYADKNGVYAFTYDSETFEASPDTQINDYPLSTTPDCMFTDGKTLFCCVYQADEEGHTALWNTKTKETVMLPMRYSYVTTAEFHGNRIYATSGDSVYYAEWDGAAIGEWKLAYTANSLD